MNTENTTAAIYARVSSTTDRQNTERQVIDLKAFADHNNLSIVKVFEEHISGAKKNPERQILTDCLQYCFDKDVSVLLLSELSRLGRNVDEVLAHVRLCKERHLNIYFQKENVSIFQNDGKENRCDHWKSPEKRKQLCHDGCLHQGSRGKGTQRGQI